MKTLDSPCAARTATMPSCSKPLLPFLLLEFATPWTSAAQSSLLSGMEL